MDIVLTVPKSHYKRHDDILLSLLDGSHFMYWTFKRRPKIEVGEYVHFVRNGRVEYFLTVIGKRGYRQDTLYLDNPQWHDRIIEVRGFQGFRYKWW